jgi:hypothetical protein
MRERQGAPHRVLEASPSSSSSPLSARTWHKAEMDKNCLFSKIGRKGIKRGGEKKENGKEKGHNVRQVGSDH